MESEQAPEELSPSVSDSTTSAGAVDAVMDAQEDTSSESPAAPAESPDTTEDANVHSPTAGPADANADFSEPEESSPYGGAGNGSPVAEEGAEYDPENAPISPDSPLGPESPLSPDAAAPESPLSVDAAPESPISPALSEGGEDPADDEQQSPAGLGPGSPGADDVADAATSSAENEPAASSVFESGNNASSGDDMDLDEDNDNRDDQDDDQDDDDDDARSPVGLGEGSPEVDSAIFSTEATSHSADAEDGAGGQAAASNSAANADIMDSEEQNDLIANIFGDSDDDDGDFLGFDAEAVTATKRHHGGEDSDSDPGVIDPLRRGHSTSGRASDGEDDVLEDEDGRPHPNAGGMSDFELMMQRKKAGRKKRRKAGDAITGMDDYVRSFIREMRVASEEDIHLNERQKAATKKLKMLPSVLQCLHQADLLLVCVDLGVLPVVAMWLTPLPDGSLPHVTIRDGMIAWLCTLPELDQDKLKTSGIGKAIMFLYRHPKETRENRNRTGKLISNWSRMIFGLQANYKLMSRDEREERDYLHMQRQQRRQSTEGEDESEAQAGLLGESGQALKPGARGFVGRARVPAPSNKDYIVRPKWNVDQEASRKGKKEPNRFEKQQLKHKQKKQVGKNRRASSISLVGTKMAL